MENRRPGSISPASPSEADPPSDSTAENHTSNSTTSSSGTNSQTLNGATASFAPSSDRTAPYDRTSPYNHRAPSFNPAAVPFQPRPPAPSIAQLSGSAESDINTLRAWFQTAPELAQASSSRGAAPPPSHGYAQAPSNANRGRIDLWSVHDVLNCHISYCRPQADKFKQRTQELEASIKACKNPYADINLASAFLQRRRDLVGAFGRLGLLSEWQLQQALLKDDTDAVYAQLDSIDEENDRLQWQGLRLDNEIHRALAIRPPPPVCGALYTQPPIGTRGLYAGKANGKQQADFATAETVRHCDREQQLLAGIGAQFANHAQMGVGTTLNRDPGIQQAVDTYSDSNPGRQNQQQPLHGIGTQPPPTASTTAPGSEPSARLSALQALRRQLGRMALVQGALMHAVIRTSRGNNAATDPAAPRLPEQYQYRELLGGSTIWGPPHNHLSSRLPTGTPPPELWLPGLGMPELGWPGQPGVIVPRLNTMGQAGWARNNPPRTSRYAQLWQDQETRRSGGCVGAGDVGMVSDQRFEGYIADEEVNEEAQQAGRELMATPQETPATDHEAERNESEDSEDEVNEDQRDEDECNEGEGQEDENGERSTSQCDPRNTRRRRRRK